MKIIFLCGSLEPGSDGVGDYTRRLAVELIRQGHSVKIIAIADKFVKTTVHEIQAQENIAVNVIRIPTSFSYTSRLPVVKAEIANEKPDWLSLQFVIFSFQPKGVPVGLRAFLSAVGANYKWHIMFHELWLGMERGSTFKHKLWGAIQLGLVKSILLTLKPQVVHTQARVYQYRLAKLGLSPKLLPLFPNISISSNTGTSFLQPNAGKGKKLSLIMFGTIHPGAPVSHFVDEVCRFAQNNNIHISLTIVGRAGKEEKLWVDICEAAGLEISVKGEQPGEVVSALLQLSDIGITTYPVSLIEKSGTVAAMLAHGLPVVSVSKPWIPRWNKISIPDGVIEYQPGNLHACFSKKKGEPTPDTVAKTAEQMMLDLQRVGEAENICTA